MDRCAECGFSWTTPRPQLIDSIASCPERLAHMITELDDRTIRVRPSPQVWSVLEYTAHTGDAIAWYHERIVRTLREDRPRFTPLDWDALCDERRYNERAVDLALEDVGEICAEFNSLLRPLRPEDWIREGVGSDGSKRTIEIFVRRAAHESVHHPADIRTNLRAIIENQANQSAR